MAARVENRESGVESRESAPDPRPLVPDPQSPDPGSTPDPETSKDLADLFDPTGRLFVTGLDGGLETEDGGLRTEDGGRETEDGRSIADFQSPIANRQSPIPQSNAGLQSPIANRQSPIPQSSTGLQSPIANRQSPIPQSLVSGPRAPVPGLSPLPGAPSDGLFDIKQRVQNELLKRLNRHKASLEGLSDGGFRAKVREMLVSILTEPSTTIPSGWTEHSLLTELLNDFLGLGPIEKFLADDTVTEIMVNRPDQIYVERHGRLELTGERFLNESQIHAVIQRIIQPLGRHVDESVPYVDARLADGSRVHVIIAPLALNGPKLTIRKFFRNKLTTDDLLRLGSLSGQMAAFLETMVRCRANILVSGGTGSGKTTLLNIISNFIPDDQRIITIEDAAELHISKNHVISLESRSASAEGTGAVSIRELVRNTLRMRPDRIVVGECRGGEALDMLQAMNTGHDGSLTTIHANSPRDALARLETLVLMAGVELPARAIREQIASGINIVVQTARLLDGSRKITNIMEVTGLGENAVFMTQEIFVFKQQGIDAAGRVIGQYQPTGTVPRIVEQLRARGNKIAMEVFANA